MVGDHSQLLINLDHEHEQLSWALFNTKERYQPKSVFKQQFEQPSAEQVNACLHWLAMASALQAILLQEELGEKAKRESTHFYHWKHVVEASTGIYIPTDAFACAALAADEFRSLVCPRLKFKMPRTKDVNSWGMAVTKPCHHLLCHLAGYQSRTEAKLQLTWNTIGERVGVGQ